jgi:hypothetical protein
MPTEIFPMNPPPKSRAYKLAKFQLTRRATKKDLVLSLVFWSLLALMWFAFAIVDEKGRTMNLLLGVMFLASIYREWEMTGHREVYQEQAKLLEEARAKQNA